MFGFKRGRGCADPEVLLVSASYDLELFEVTTRGGYPPMVRGFWCFGRRCGAGLLRRVFEQLPR